MLAAKDENIEKEKELEYLRLNFRHQLSILTKRKRILLESIIRKNDQNKLEIIRKELAKH